jgi:hypothetical protein
MGIFVKDGIGAGAYHGQSILYITEKNNLKGGFPPQYGM